MGFLDGLFGSKVDPVERKKIMKYLISEGRIRVTQDDGATAYDSAAAKHGGNFLSDPTAAKELAIAAEALAKLDRDLVEQHAAMQPVPDGAGESYSAWHLVYLALAVCAEHTASMIEAISELESGPEYPGRAEKILSFSAPRGVALLEEEKMARQQALKDEAKLVKRCRIRRFA